MQPAQEQDANRIAQNTIGRCDKYLMAKRKVSNGKAKGIERRCERYRTAMPFGTYRKTSRNRRLICTGERRKWKINKKGVQHSLRMLHPYPLLNSYLTGTIRMVPVVYPCTANCRQPEYDTRLYMACTCLATAFSGSTTSNFSATCFAAALSCKTLKL